MCRWYKKGWFHKVAALTIATSYFILLIFINNTSYVWATLALVFVLFVTTFTFSSAKSPLLLHLRGTRAGAFTATRAENSDGQDNEEVSTNTAQQQMTIWVTDVPPSYSFVMSDMPPPTPPPSYGSAILMFPPPYVDLSKSEQAQQETPISPALNPRRFRPLSISTQVSVTSATSECPTPQISVSTQISLVNASSDPFSDTVSLRTQLFLSRQVSREDLQETDDDSIDIDTNAIELHSCEIPVIVLNGTSDLSEESDTHS